LNAQNFLRRPRGVAGHREWLHFYVSIEGLDLFINLSLFDDQRPAAVGGERARVLVFARDHGKWAGDAEDIGADDFEVCGGELACRFGDVSLDENDGVMHLRGGLQSKRISFDLHLDPSTFGSLATDVSLGRGSAINWLVVPQLRAHGSIRVEGVTHQVFNADAYHDHNWGDFGHGDFRWQWAHLQSASCSIVLARLLDGVAGRAFQQSLFVWRGVRISKIFRGVEVNVTPVGFLRPKRVMVLPRLASLLATGATEVPERFEIEARSGDDYLRGAFALEDVACLVLSDDRGLDTTLLYEVLGRARLAGKIHGEALEIDARVVFETMRRSA
jgi:hypothetical protein